MDQVLYISEIAYQEARWAVPKDFMSFAHFCRAIDALEPTSSPGYPLCLNYSTIADYFGTCDKLVWSRDKKMMTWEMFNRFLSDPDHYFRVFIKQEPHKPEKVQEGRWRLIFAASLMLNLLGKMLFGPQTERELASVGFIPSAYGFEMAHGGWARLKEIMDQKGLVTSLDKSSWDLFSPGWVYGLKRRLRSTLCLNPDQKWEELADLYYSLAYRKSKFVFSSGNVYSQEVDGMMKSGLPTTIDDNSTAQWFLHVLASIRCGIPVTELLSVGDDTIQPPITHPGYVEELEKAGCKVKSVEEASEQEFVGFRFRSDGVMPMYTIKHMSKVCHVKTADLPDVLDSYMLLYAFDPVRNSLYRGVAKSLNIPLRSQNYYRHVMNYPKP